MIMKSIFMGFFATVIFVGSFMKVTAADTEIKATPIHEDPEIELLKLQLKNRINDFMYKSEQYTRTQQIQKNTISEIHAKQNKQHPAWRN